ncbi:MAG: hydroxylamine reductase [Deferrisomatales bacterium]|nr:hydroxylamine reductase [Deferrisomatales bacterium]
MFCNQCEQTAQGTGCTKHGVCGKTPQVAALQDLLSYAVRGLSQVAVAGREVGVTDAKVNRFTAKAVFSTLTNVDFDPARFDSLIRETVKLRGALQQKVAAAGGPAAYADPAASYQPAADLAGLQAQGEKVRLPINWEADEDIKSLQEITLYGLRGVAAYADHAAVLGQEDDALYAAIQKKMTQLADKSLGLQDWVGLALDTGKDNLRAMELLDAGNTGHYGHPVPTSVSLGHKAGKAILITGHDLKDLEDLLKQTEGKGISIYTHGEMLPAHGYPGLKKYPHLAGHYGTAWQNQKKEFPAFPGAILFTTNCIQEPAESYKGNLFTTGLVGWPGVTHVPNGQFGAVIASALAMPGFPGDQAGDSVMVGFARNAVLGVADKVIAGVKAGAIKHFFLVGGCDGAKPGRNYYTEFVEKTPKDTVVLTLACGKFRFFDQKIGDIGGIPRLLDVGQCNDAYSAVQIAVALANAFECGVNDLPLSIICSWYEQKAVAILLSLLSLGIKGIRLGPSLPAFITPNVLGVLVENFDIKPIGTVDEDLKACLAA